MSRHPKLLLALWLACATCLTVKAQLLPAKTNNAETDLGSNEANNGSISIKTANQVEELASKKSRSSSQLGGLVLIEQAHNHQLSANSQLGDISLSSSMLKTFIRINNMRAYHLDLHSYRPQVRFSGDADFVDSENPQHLARCAHHLNQYQLLLKSFIELDPVLDKTSSDSLRLADSFGRPEAGILSGTQFWLGSYSGCLNFEHKVAIANEMVRGQYCLGLSQYPNWNPQDSVTSIKVGLCLPETCTTSMLNDNRHLLEQVETMMKYQFGQGKAFKRLKLREVYCLPHETSQIRRYTTSTLVFFLFIGLFVTLSVLATTFDHLTSKLPTDQGSLNLSKKSKRRIFIEAFSLSRNVDKLFSIRRLTNASSTEIRRDPTSETDLSTSNDEGELVPLRSFDKQTFLDCTTGLKCIGLFWIICAHTFLVAPITSNNLIDIDKLTKTYLADIYLTAHLVVDTFFVLSGLLAAYLLFSEDIGKLKTKHWIVLTVHRYWRLTPIYLINYWFTKSVGSQINTGPMWDYGTAELSPRLNCARESWFEAIFHLSDFKSPKEHCVPFAWFIANGIKFWLVTPLFLILIHKSLRRGYTLTIGAILANIAIVFTLALQSKVDMKSLIEFKPESANNMLNNMEDIYTRPYSRIGTYLIGLLAGHLIYLVDSHKLEVRLSKNANIIIWTLFSVTVIVLTFVLKIAGGLQLEEDAIPWVFALTSALIRPLWALCTCWFIFAMSTGQIKWMVRFLSANFWKILVKLSFCAYLVQGEVIAQLYLSATSAGPFTYKDMIAQSIVTITLTLLVSSLIVLFIEYPLIGIEQLILPRKQVLKNAPPSEESDGIVDKNCEKPSTNSFSFDKSDCTKLKSS